MAARNGLVLIFAATLLVSCARFGPATGEPGNDSPPDPLPARPTAGSLSTPGRVDRPHGLVAERTIAFVSDRGGQVDIWLEDIETRQVWRLTNDRQVESSPVWSPDGTMLAYVTEDDREVRNIWVLDLRTGVTRQLTREEPPFNVHRLAWLAGGQTLLYDTGKAFDRRPDLRIVTVEGHVLAPVLPDEGSVIYDWSTNGGRLVAAVGQPLGEPRVVVVDAVPGALLHPQSGAPVGFAVELSPDGRFVTYFAPPLSDNQTAWVLSVRSGATQPLNEGVEGRRYDHDLSWSPDGAWLVFVHGVGGVTDGSGRLKLGTGPPPTADPFVGLYLMDWQGGSRQRLTLGSADGAPTWSPDQRWISYLSDGVTHGTSDIWLLEISSPRRLSVNLTHGNGNNWSPVWMPLPNTPGRP